VVIGRFINADWRNSSAVQLQITIPPFDVEKSFDIIRQKLIIHSIDLPEDMIRQMAFEIDRLTAGHPSSVLSIIDHIFDHRQMAVVLDRRHDNYFFRPIHCTELFDRYVRPNLESVLIDLRPEFLREAYTVLSVFRGFFGGLINTLQEHQYIRTELKPLELIDKLQSTGYVARPDTLGFYNDSILRRVVALQMRIDAPQRFRELNEFAWQYWSGIALKNEDLLGRKLMVSDAKQIRCILEALYHFLIRRGIEYNLERGGFDAAATEKVLEELVQQLIMYTDQLRSSTGPDDIPPLRNQLEEMLKKDYELANEVYSLLGHESWKRLVATPLGH
jgi:hypothetical protein